MSEGGNQPGRHPICRDHAERMARLERTLYGTNGEMGIRTRLMLIWRSYVALYAIVGVVVGAAITVAVQLLTGV